MEFNDFVWNTEGSAPADPKVKKKNQENVYLMISSKPGRGLQGMALV